MRLGYSDALLHWYLSTSAESARGRVCVVLVCVAGFLSGCVSSFCKAEATYVRRPGICSITSLPPLCCCAGSRPTEEFHATASRTTGKRVVRTDSRSWTFPICADCLDWIEVQQAATTLLYVFIGLVVCAAGSIVIGLAFIRESAGILLLICGLALGGFSPFVLIG